MTGGSDWRAIRDELLAREPDHLDAADHDRLADACFWTDDVEASMTHRRQAHRLHADAGDDAAAGMAAWRLFYDHHLVGEVAVANGWRARAARHVHDTTAPLAGWLALADTDLAPDPATAVQHARRAVEIAVTHRTPDLHAMALTALGRTRIALGERREGLAHLDEAMVAVINDELQPLYTGWVFCNVVGTCYSIADLQRAGEWSDAALRWCATLRDGHMYPGLCRVYSAEVAGLRGEWDRAATEAEQACRDLERYDERYAAHAHHLRGELALQRGRPDDAQAAFARSVELGGRPLPGQALLDAEAGRGVEALATLRQAADDSRAMPLPRTTLLRAVLDVALSLGDVAAAEQATAAITDIAQECESALLTAHALAAQALMIQEPPARVGALRTAVTAFDDLDVPFDTARLQSELADAYEAVGDPANATLTRDAADATLHALGVEPSRSESANPLSPREREVLGLVAQGCTNHEIADRLTVSPHTVNRHVTNIMTKLGVHSRAAASARAVTDRLL